MKNFVLTIFVLLSCAALQAQKNLPYSTGFDTPADRNDWMEFRPGHNSLHGWGYATTGAHSATHCISHDYPVGGDAGDTVRDWFTSPALRITANAKLSLWADGFSMIDTTSVDYFGIWYSTTHRNPTMGNYIELADLTGLFKSGAWVDTGDIAIPADDSAFIAIVYHATNNWVTIEVDDIHITGASSSISKPSRSSVSVYPNPSRDEVNFALHNAAVTNPVITLYNALGQEVLTKYFTGSTVQLRCGHLPEGIYHYSVTNNQEVVGQGKIVLQ